MTDNTQAAFEKGRAKAFQAIRDMIRLDIDKMAVSAVNDQLGFGQSPEPHLVSPVKAGIESLHNHCTAVLDALEAGETVYSLTGADTIRTYRNITGGDELAGAMSAVEDMKVMLFSMDLDEIGKPFSKPAQVKSQHDESQVAASYRGAKKAADPFMSHGLAIAYETILLRIEEKIARKIPAPKVIGLNGEAPANEQTDPAAHGLPQTGRAGTCLSLADAARGPGETYADGFEAARDWVKYKISVLEVKQSWDRTPNKEQAANKLRSFWMKQTDSIIDSVTGAATMQTSQPAAEKRKQAKRKAPGL